jgi:hypothetical protein
MITSFTNDYKSSIKKNKNKNAQPSLAIIGPGGSGFCDWRNPVVKFQKKTVIHSEANHTKQIQVKDNQ